MKRRLLGLALASLACAAQADSSYTVVRVEADKLRLFWRDDHGKPLRRLDRLAAWQKARGQTLAFGMNAGMYHADASPVGLLIVDGRELAPLNLADGKGNFFLKPNGVFFIDAQGPHVVDSADYPASHEGVKLATQSGPLLLRQGQIPAALGPNSASRHIRNGVCAAGSQGVFVISERPVTLHEFASYFRDVLRCQDALYLDGAVSSLYSPSLGRNDRWTDLGPLIGAVE